MYQGRCYKIATIFLSILVSSCGYDQPVALDFSDKISTTFTSDEELPKLNGEWDGYYHDNFTPSDKVTRLVRGQQCDNSKMILDIGSKKVTFNFGREFFEYYISKEVKYCPTNSKNCSCHEYDGKKECAQYSIGKGECTLRVSANVQETVLVKRDSLIGSSSNRYLRLVNLQSELKYLSSEVENTKLPVDKDLPYGFYSGLERAKANCDSFDRVWLRKSEPFDLVYRLSEDKRQIIFPGKESNPLSISWFDSPLMAFEK